MDLSAKICKGTEARFRPDLDTIPEICVTIRTCVHLCVCVLCARDTYVYHGRGEHVGSQRGLKLETMLTLTCPICRISLKLKKYAKISEM